MACLVQEVLGVANKHGFRTFWFKIHKWLGIGLALLVMPLSLSGSALVWHDWLDDTGNPQRNIAGNGEAILKPSAYIHAARSSLDNGQPVASLRFNEGHAAIVGAGSGLRAQRTNVWIDPANGKVLDVAAGDAGLYRKVHAFHDSLFIPRIGRKVVGWLGVAMLVSSLTGLWLWWPTAGSVVRGLRWRRAKDTYTNLHHQAGFWICIPLGMLSFTGIWITFSSFFAIVSGDVQLDQAERAARMWAKPLVATATSVDAATAAALANQPGKLVSIVWPTDFDAKWRFWVDSAGKVTEVAVIDATGAARRVGESDPDQEPGGIARIMRQLHDGAGMGLAWQIAIFIGGIMPVVLGITGLVMWWRSRGWRADVSRRMNDRKAA